MTSSPGSILSLFSPRLGGNSSTTPLTAAPRWSNPDRGTMINSEAYDLSELSPRPSSPLLLSDREQGLAQSPPSSMEKTAFRDDLTENWKGKDTSHDEGGRLSQLSTMDGVTEQKRARRSPRWKPPSPSDILENDYLDEPYLGARIHDQNNTDQHSSVVGSLLLGRANKQPEATSIDVDATFRVIDSRAAQMQSEIQKLLDAQSMVLERSAKGGSTLKERQPSEMSDETARSTSRASSITSSSSPMQSRNQSDHGRGNVYNHGRVVPVRQPKSRTPTIRQIRGSIARSISLLADLKLEEDAYIGSALAARRDALAKGDRLASQHKRIMADLRALESDPDDSLRKEMRSVQQEHEVVSLEIEECEQRLRTLRRSQADLEARMMQVKSERESGLSGYRGALKETERNIGEMMRRPGIKVLENNETESMRSVPHEQDTAHAPRNTNDARDKHEPTEVRLGGREFMLLRPERRTLGMARDWWQGEIALLERRKLVVDRERAALEGGGEVWASTVQAIVDYEARLSAALLSASSIASPGSKFGAQDETLARTLQAQLTDLQTTAHQLQSKLSYVEGKGWNLLVAAIGAELAGFLEGEVMLRSFMQSQGIDAEEATTDTGGHSNEIVSEGLLDLQETEMSPQQTGDALHLQVDEEMSNSAIRRWTHSETQPSQYSDAVENHNQPDIVHDGTPDEDKEESDNEVPPGLLSEVLGDEERQ